MAAEIRSVWVLMEEKKNYNELNVQSQKLIC